MTALQSLVAANNKFGNSLISGAGSIASQAFRNLGSWRDDDVIRYINQIAPFLTGAKLQAAKSSVSFYKSIADLTGQDWTQPVITASDVSTMALRKGVGTDVVYRRPFVDMRTALANGQDMRDAIESGARRAQILAETEVQLARRNAGLRARSANDKIVGYIRTLTGAENCALCYVASTQRYHKGDLMPIHPGCDCGEMPIYGTQDPGQVINEVRLDGIHENVNERFGAWAADARTIDYRAIRIQEHGEMGPILTVQGQRFTTSDLIGPRVELGGGRFFYADEAFEVTYGREAVGMAGAVRRVAAANEPAITAALQKIEASTGAKLSGLAFRKKGLESLARKIAKDAEEKGMTLLQAADDISDAVRYTFVAEPMEYASKTADVIAQLTAAGYRPLKVKNYWQTGNGYKGINSNWISPSGQRIEVQFHTPKSLETKEPSHKLYEDSRKLPDGPEKDALVQESRQMWAGVSTPPNITGIGQPSYQ